MVTPLLALLVVREYLSSLVVDGFVASGSSDLMALIPLFVGIAVATVTMLWLMKRRHGGALMQGVLYLAMFQGSMVIFQAWLRPELAVSISLLLILLYAARPWVWLHNLVLMIALGGIGVLLGVQFSVLALVIFSVALVLYDAFAVWKSRHMVALVKGMAAQRVFFGFIFPHERARYGVLVRSFNELKGLSFLGTGDVVIPGMLVVGASFISLTQALGVFAGACAGFFTLLYASYRGAEGRMYPGLPLIVTGALLGLFLATL